MKGSRVFGAALVVVLLTLSAFGGWGAAHQGPTLSGSSGLRTDLSLITVNTHVQTTCLAVVTCSLVISVAANSAITVFAATFASTTVTAAIHGVVLTTLSGGASPTVYCFVANALASGTDTVFVNTTGSSYYAIQAVDFAGVAFMGSSYKQASGTSNTGTGTLATLGAAQTLLSPYEIYVGFVGIKTTAESSITPVSPQAQIDFEATTTNVVTVEDQFASYPYEAPYLVQATLAASASAVGFVLGMLPVGTAPSAPKVSCYGAFQFGALSVVDIEWTVPSGSVGYVANWTIRYSPLPFLGGTATFYTNVATANQTATTLSNIATYGSVLVAVRAWNSTIIGALSATVTCSGEPPPVDLNGRALSTTSVALIWKQAEPANYVVNDTVGYGTVLGSWTTLASAGIANATTITGLTVNTTYYFIVWAWNLISETVATNIVAVQTLSASSDVDPPVVAPPVLAGVANTTNQALLSWSAAVNVTVANYSLNYGTTYGAYSTHVSEGVVLHANVGSLAQNTTYWFVVVGWTAGGNTITSNVVPVRTLSPHISYVNTTTYHNTTTLVNNTLYHNTTTNVYHNTTTYVNTTNNYNLYHNTTTNVYHNATVYVNTTSYHNTTVHTNITTYHNTTTFVNTTHNNTLYHNTTTYSNTTTFHNTTVVQPFIFPWTEVVLTSVLISLIVGAIFAMIVRARRRPPEYDRDEP